MIDTAAALVDVDSQRIMAVSIGKIQASRGQRGGPTLRKSLLISTILHKARTSMMMENFQAMMDSQRSQEVPQSQECPETSEDHSQMEPEAPIPVTVSCSAWSTGPPEPEPEEDFSEDYDKENPAPVYTALTTVASPPQSPLDVLREKDVNSDPSYDPSCAKCSKRRFSDAQLPCSESDSENNNMCKRQRLESSQEDTEYEQSCQYSSQEYSSCMQTDQNPISSLVSRFNSGLSGFLGGVTGCENESCASTVSKDLVMSRTCIALAV